MRQQPAPINILTASSVGVMRSLPRTSVREGRRAARARPHGVCVRVHRSEGLVLDISETGALIRLPVPQIADELIFMTLDWSAGFVRLGGRVVRAVPCLVQQPPDTPVRTEYLVAIEFVGLSEKSAAALQRLIEGA